MSSYPYSIDNVRQILKELNVTGKMKRDWMHVVRGNDDIDLVQVRQEYNTLRKEYHKMEKDNSDELLEMRERLSEKKQNIQDTEDDIIDDIYKRISQKDIRLQINVQQTKDKKSIFEAKDRESYFLCKLINHELERVYKIETYSRDSIISDLSQILSDQHDKVIIRTDVKSFFESIPRVKLMDKLTNDGIISNRTLKLLRRLNFDLSKMDVKYSDGVPRGLSFASTLSEIYLRDIDRRINQISGLYYYRRFVDDIIIIANNVDDKGVIEIQETVNKLFTSKGLMLHHDDEKSFCKAITYPSKEKVEFNYLGYHIEVYGTGNVKFSLSKDRFERYKSYIDNILTFYSKHAFIRPKDRIKGKNCSKMRHSQPIYKLYIALDFLTRNYNLSGRKSNIKSGIYFKHRNLTEVKQLAKLDKYLYDSVDKYINPKAITCKSKIPDGFCEGIVNKIKSHYSFEKGFSNRLMCHLSSADIKAVKRIIKYNGK